MAKCSICGKGVTFGHNVSHSNRKTNRTWKPNIRKVKAVVNGTNQTISVCSRCLRSGKVERAELQKDFCEQKRKSFCFNRRETFRALPKIALGKRILSY